MKRKFLLLSIIICSSYTIWCIVASFALDSPYIYVNGMDVIFQIIFCGVLVLYYRKPNSHLEPETARVRNNKKDLSSEKTEYPIKAPRTTLNEVAGLHEVKDELMEVIDFLKSPEKYRKMGAKLPKGILFHGPSGTGKTLLAKAIAGESFASFHNACGSEFVEKYVGVGAKRVRSLFEKAKKECPSVIFIDEIDAIGAKRTNETNNEKDQTLNQLLVEIDGFVTNESVIIIGATNRLDLLDEALLRPGRFDRQMYVGRPDVKAREEILEVHFQNKPLDKTIHIRDVAKKTSGMTGAHLANIANEAAILAVRHRKNIISNSEIDDAIEKVIAGLERKSAIISDLEKNKVAFHESGHALIGKYLNTDIISKVSIIPRGQALGYTLQIPEEDRYLVTEIEMKEKVKVLFGGRAAEQIIFNEISSGAKDDLRKANNIAYEMVCELGMSRLGNIIYDENIIRNCFTEVNNEVKTIIDECYEDALRITSDNIDILKALATALIEKESLCGEEINDIIHKIHPDFSLPKKAFVV